MDVELPGFWSFDGRCFVKGEQVDRVTKRVGDYRAVCDAARREFRSWLRLRDVTFVEVLLTCNEQPTEVWVRGRLRVKGVR